MDEFFEVDGAIAIGVGLHKHVFDLLVSDVVTEASEQVGKLLTGNCSIEVGIHGREGVSQLDGLFGGEL